MEIPKQAINKVVSLNIVKSRQGNFVTIFTEKGFDTDDDNLMLRIYGQTLHMLLMMMVVVMVMTIAMMTLTDAWEGIAQIQIQRQIQIQIELHKYTNTQFDKYTNTACY